MSWGGEEERKGRPIITDQQGVRSTSDPSKLVVVDSDAEVVDLLGEGSIEGLVSGTYRFEGNKGYTGFFTGETFTTYTATGVGGTADEDQMKALGFLRSVYWNDTPVVDQNGYYNFSNINVEYTKGLPEGNLANLNSRLPAQETLDLTVERPIGERLYGVSIQGGTIPSPTQNAGDLATDSRIDAVAKTYTILNKECNKIQLRVRINQLFEQIRGEDAPKDYEKGKKIPPVGYGDIKAREIRYNIYYQPIFDYFSDEINEERPKITAWTFVKTEKVYGHVSQVYVRSTTIDFTGDHTDQPGFSGWKIKVIRTTPESLTAYLKNTSFIDSIVEIYGTKLRYPYSTMVYSKFDAEFFSRIPARSYDTNLLKIKVPNNYHPIRKSYGRSDAMTKGSDALYTTTTLIRSGQRIYWQSGAIMKAHADLTIGTHNLAAWPGTIWVRTGTPYGNHTYPIENETGATLEGYIGNVTNPDGVGTTERMGTASDSFWDGGFKEIVNWPGAAGTLPLEGSPTIIKEWTNNPAWCFYDLVTNPRYGLGDYIDNDFVDKWALYEIAQYCDVLVPDGTGGLEPRFTMNHIIVSREEAYKVLNDLSSIFRGLVYYANGLVYAVQDAFREALYQYNNTNVVEGNFNYASSAKKARHSVAVVRYIDKTNQYLPAVEYIENEESIKRYGIRQIETTALGCTSRGQARRFGEWLLASEAQETESVTFSVGQDGAYLKPGDVVQIYDQYRTPLKFAGRTNAVRGLTKTDSPGATVIGNDAYNSIILDNAVAFTKSSPQTIYKFSLLTPTYNYESTGISDLNSDDEIRRTSVQDLYFAGEHTRTVTGQYSSDYQREGSGIATEIYFSTGLLVDGTPIGTGNQLDFDNYVITGYTNNYVNGSLGVSYSGGCFSGENLVWSTEVNDPTKAAYISGNFSNYRVINVAENDDQTTYAVSALAYSTGKYDEVENRLDFGNVVIDDKPLWPHILYDGALAGYTASGIQDNASITLGSPNKKGEGAGPDAELEWKTYNTFEIRIPQASTRLNDGTEQAGATPRIIKPEPKYTLPDRMSYTVYVFDQPTLGKGFNDPSLQMSDSLFKIGKNPAAITVGTILHEVSLSDFIEYYQPETSFTVGGNPKNFATADGFAIEGEENKPVRFFLEKLLTEDTNYWFAVFAYNNFTRSSQAIVGLIPASASSDSAYISNNDALKNNVIPEGSLSNFNIVGGISLSELTSSSVTTDEVSYTSLNQLSTTQPSFTWKANSDLLFYDDYDKRLDMVTAQTYRITIRKYNERFPLSAGATTHTPSSDIYVELTGVDLPDENAVFDFIHDYNSPQIISSLFDSPDAIQYDGKGNANVTDANTEWFRVETSGIIYKNSPNNFPLRQFDIVIEAHDGFGTTSAGNKVYDGTLNLYGPFTPDEGYATQSNTYAIEDGKKRGYDFVPCSLGIPSGIVFSQTDSLPDDIRLDDYSFLSQGQAHLRQYPYLATASIYNNGFLDINMQSSKDAAGNTIFTNSQILNSFPDVRGLVYYYSTGDNSIKDDKNPANGHLIFSPNNKAPYFTMKPLNIPGSKNFGAQGNVKFVDTDSTSVSYDDAPTPTEDIDAPDNGTVYRWYHLFDSSTNPANIRIPFPKIAASNVQNVHLTIGLFDTLSYLQHFNADNSPKTELVVAEASAAPPTPSATTAVPGVVIDSNGNAVKVDNQTTPTILLEQNIKFSTVPYASHDAKGEPIDWDDTVYDTTSKEGFKLAQGTPCFLKESSLQTKGQSALAYRAWWDITLDPGEQKFRMDFNDECVYIGPHKRKQDAEGKFVVSSYENKNKFKGISSINFKLSADSIVRYGDKNTLSQGDLYLNFETLQDPLKYTVDVEFKGANMALVNKENVKITDENKNKLNPNDRDFQTNDYPLPQCRLVEKSEKYVKFHVEPFFIMGSSLGGSLDQTDIDGTINTATAQEWKKWTVQGVHYTPVIWKVTWRTQSTNANNQHSRWRSNTTIGPVNNNDDGSSKEIVSYVNMLEGFTWRYFTDEMYDYKEVSGSGSYRHRPQVDTFAEMKPAFQMVKRVEAVNSSTGSDKRAFLLVLKTEIMILVNNDWTGLPAYSDYRVIANAWPNFAEVIADVGGTGIKDRDPWTLNSLPVWGFNGAASRGISNISPDAESLSSKVGDYIHEEGLDFVGNQIKIKGGILETDTFDIVPQ